MDLEKSIESKQLLQQKTKPAIESDWFQPGVHSSIHQAAHVHLHITQNKKDSYKNKLQKIFSAEEL